MAPLPALLACQRSDDLRFLDVDTAWTIALTWLQELRNKVILDLAGEKYQLPILGQSYTWVRFNVSLDSQQQVSAARAAALTWFALSCCPGYSGRDNPVFWKCVFSEYARSHFVWNRKDQSITDGYGFFNGEGVDFPQFRLTVYTAKPAVKLFCGLRAEHVGVEDGAKLDQVLAMLTPWVDAERSARRPVVSLADLHSSYFVGKDGGHGKTPNRPATFELAELVADLQNPKNHQQWPATTFSVDEIDFHGYVSLSGDPETACIQRLIRELDVRIPVLMYYEGSVMSPQAQATLVSEMLHLPGASARGAVVKLYPENTGSNFAAYASALPYTTSLRSLHLSYRNNHDQSDPTALVWLSYALFHPDSPASTWQGLTLAEIKWTDRIIDILRAMARGNNVAALLDGREPTSDGYYQARVVGGAFVYVKPVIAHSEPCEADVLVVSDGSLTVDVCDVTSVDTTLWGEWVPVVVPTYGLGYVRSVHLVDVQKRAPAEPFLTSLQLGDYSYHKYRTTAFSDILRLVGPNLKSLDITKCRQFLSVEDLRDALKACRSLESLAVTNSGDLWCETGFLPRLRELHLVVEKGTHHLGSMQLPQSLEILRIHASWYLGLFSQSHDAVKRLLTQPGNLRVFHWQEGLTESYSPTPYAETCADTAKRLQDLGLKMDQRCTQPSPLPRPQLLAFLSAVSGRDPSWPRGRLGQEVVKRIIVFAGTRGDRVIVLEPEGDEIPGHRRRPPPI